MPWAQTPILHRRILIYVHSLHSLHAYIGTSYLTTYFYTSYICTYIVTNKSWPLPSYLPHYSSSSSSSAGHPELTSPNSNSNSRTHNSRWRRPPTTPPT